MRPVFVSEVRVESEQVASMLRGAGFEVAVSGAQSAFGFFPGVVRAEVLVPDEDFDDALAFLEKSKIQLDAPASDAAVLEGNVCPVHEKAAIAVCSRCGTFLCAECGALGDVPICEQCVARPVETKPRPAWVRFVAQAWVTVWFAQFFVGVLIAMLVWAAWFFGFRGR